MTREEIQEGIAVLLKDFKDNEDPIDWTDVILSYLHSKGVVRKVDRECPHITAPLECATKLGVFHATQIDMLEAGYVVCKPLIEEKE